MLTDLQAHALNPYARSDWNVQRLKIVCVIMLMKNKQCPLSFKAIKIENPCILINFFSFSSVERFRTNELFYLCLIYSDLLNC